MRPSRWDQTLAFPDYYRRLVAHYIGEAREYRGALVRVAHVGDADPDCNLCGEYLDAREIARKALDAAKRHD